VCPREDPCTPVPPLPKEHRQVSVGERDETGSVRTPSGPHRFAAGPTSGLLTMQKRGRGRGVRVRDGARGVSVSAEQEAKVRGGSEGGKLEAWLRGALTASSAARLLAEPRARKR